MSKTVKTPVMDREAIEAIAAEIAARMETPVSEDSADYQSLLSSRTKQHALSASLGRPTPPDPSNPDTDDSGDPYKNLSEVGRFAQSVNKSEAFDKDGSETTFSDVLSDDAVIETLARIILSRKDK